MLGFQVQGQFLELYPETAVTFTINTPLYTGGDPTSIPGTYSVPVSIPLTDANKQLLKHPHIINNVDKFATYKDVVFYAEGLPVFKGELMVSNAGISAGRAVAEVTFVVNPFSAIKETYIDELPLQRVTALAAKGTTLHPELFNYAFFPVMNAYFSGKSIDELQDIASGSWADFYDVACQNFYNIALQDFSPTSRAITPFVKVKYIVEQIFASAGIILVDELFADDEEMQLLYQYSNRAIPSWSSAFHLEDQLPHIKSNEYIKQLASLFFAGIFANVFTNEVKIKSLADVVAAPHVHDWTYAAAPDYKIVENDTPSSFEFEADSNDNLFNRSTYSTQEFDDIRQTTSLGSPAPPVTGSNVYYEGNNFARFFGESITHQKYFWKHVSEADGDPYEIKMVPLFMAEHLRKDNRQFWWNGQGPYNRYCPMVEIAGYSPEVNQDEASEDFPLANRIVFYRGMQSVTHANPNDTVLHFDGEYPMASNNVYNEAGQKIADQALLLNTDHGIVEKRAKPWIHFLENRDTVQKLIYLNIKDIVNFKAEDKVRIQNNNYFVSKMKITFRSSNQPRKVIAVDATLETTI